MHHISRCILVFANLILLFVQKASSSRKTQLLSISDSSSQSSLVRKTKVVLNKLFHYQQIRLTFVVDQGSARSPPTEVQPLYLILNIHIMTRTAISSVSNRVPIYQAQIIKVEHGFGPVRPCFWMNLHVIIHQMTSYISIASTTFNPIHLDIFIPYIVICHHHLPSLIPRKSILAKEMFNVVK